MKKVVASPPEVTLIPLFADRTTDADRVAGTTAASGAISVKFAATRPQFAAVPGITMLTSLASLLRKKKVVSNLAMTGEITLRGRVLPIGGLKEKLLAAIRSGINKVIIPKDNEKDLDEIPDNVKKKIKIVIAEKISDVLEESLVKKLTPIKWKENDVVIDRPLEDNEDKDLVRH